MNLERTKNGCGVNFTCFLSLEGLRHGGTPNLPDLRFRSRRTEPYRWQRLAEVMSMKG